MQTKRLRWGVLGTARIADAVVPAIRMSSNCELAAVASRDLTLAQAWARERNVPRSFGSYEEMLASDAIDAVYIPLPNALHREWTIRAAQNGKHVLCEKPLATNTLEAKEMIAAAEANGVVLMEAFMYRFHPQTEQLRQLVTDGVVGQVKMVRANFGFYLGRPDDVRWSKELGGGALLDVGCYCVNIARLVMNLEPVSASARAIWASTGVDETLSGVLEFANGALGVIGCSFRTGAWLDQSLVASGTNGRIKISEPFRMGDDPIAIVLDSLDVRNRSDTVQVPGANEYQRMVEHFASAVLNNRTPDYTPQDSLGNMRVLDALAESARTGRSVAI
jgi:xylose dehydrogenase (NAD/NADP)